MRRHPNRGLRFFISRMACVNSCDGPEGPGLRLDLLESNVEYFLFIKALWNLINIEGLIAMAILNKRLGLMMAVRKAKINQSHLLKFGALFRRLFRVMSCLRSKIFSATSDFFPPTLARIAKLRKK